MTLDQNLKAQLARALCEIVGRWTQAEAASLMHLHQSEVSRLRNGEFGRFSVGRLVRLIAARGYDIHVELRPMPRPFDPSSPKPGVSVTIAPRALAGVRVPGPPAAFD